MYLQHRFWMWQLLPLVYFDIRLKQRKMLDLVAVVCRNSEFDSDWLHNERTMWLHVQWTEGFNCFIHYKKESTVFNLTRRSFALTLKYSTRPLQVILLPLISFTSMLPGLSSHGTRIFRLFKKSPSISRRRGRGEQLVSDSGTCWNSNCLRSVVFSFWCKSRK